MKLTYKNTLHACYTGMVTQAAINNLAPLLFVIFQDAFHISFEMIGRLVLINFGVQLAVDMIAAKYADKIGYRRCVVCAHLFCVLGLIGLSVFPMLLPAPYIGLVCAVVLYAIGGGIIEVLVSPMVEAIPSDGKALSMSLAHSFYCWGQMLVVLLTTLLLRLIGTELWYLLPWIWALIPLYNMLMFMRVPIAHPTEGADAMPVRKLFSQKTFWFFLIIMACAGASELSMSQWSSLFAQKGLSVPKVVGDILGPCMFAFLMGLGRLGYGLWGGRINLKYALAGCAGLCILCYLTVALTNNPMLSLAACAVCGFSVSLMWPGAVSMSAKSFPLGGTAMFGILAMFGDLGCSLGPWVTGAVAGAVESGMYTLRTTLLQAQTLEQAGLKCGILAAVIFPVLLLICILFLKGKRENS